MTKTVPEMLRAGADTYEERNKIYGDNYKRHGFVMSFLFPNGVTLDTIDKQNRFGVLTQMVAKMTRYCENFDRGGHEDSLHDLMVYTAMLAEVDAETKERENIDPLEERRILATTEDFPDGQDTVDMINSDVQIDFGSPTELEIDPPGWISEIDPAVLQEPANEEPPVVIPEDKPQKVS